VARSRIENGKNQFGKKVVLMCDNFRKHLLLTGAGFTKNFGGCLGSEMWVKLFNNRLIQKHEPLRKILLSNCEFDYEMAYQKVLDSRTLSDEQKQDFRLALLEAYQSLDDSIIEKSSVQLTINNQLNQFLSKFGGCNGEKGFIFTINQDLYIERYCRGVFAFRRFLAPAVNNSIFDEYQSRKLNESDFEIIPDGEISSNSKSSFLGEHDSFYIKLHGSFHWKGPDGRSLLIVGTRKAEDKDRYGILRWYWEIFEKVLMRENVRLLIIGYGFRDKHLNDVLHRAIKANHLKIYIICPRSGFISHRK